jgi:peptide/nickel transport system permease protein
MTSPLSSPTTDLSRVPAVPTADHSAPDRAEVQSFVASHWKLMWWRFRRHKLALVSGVITLVLYLIALFCEFLAPVDPGNFEAEYKYAPPQRLHVIDNRDGTSLGLYVFGYKSEVDPVALRRTFTIDETQKSLSAFSSRATPISCSA